MSGASRATWQNWRILAMLGLVFLAGAVTGALGMRAGLHSFLHRHSQPNLSYENLKGELDLNPAQATQLRSILDDMGKYNEDLQDQLQTVQTEINDVRATGKSRILQILNPGQQARFEKICGDLPR